MHDAVQYLANRYQLPFIDYNDGYLLEKTGIFLPYDMKDEIHSNIYGATKFTDSIGNYLITHFEYDEISKNPVYEFMKEQYADYYEMYEDSWLQNIQSLTGYCAAVNKDRYSIFVATNGGDFNSLTEDDRFAMGKSGFSAFEDLKYDRTYAGVKSNGKVIADIQSETFLDRILIDGRIDDFDGLTLNTAFSEKINGRSEPVILPGEEHSYEKLLGQGFFSIYCGGRFAGRFASIVINGSEYSKNNNGINIVVYNNKTRMVVDSASFMPSPFGARRVYDQEKIKEYQKITREQKLRSS